MTVKYREVVRGVKDFLPREAALKREIENQTVEIFERWGYREVVTPTFEYLEVIEAGAGPAIRDEVFLFQDRDGRVVALRPEMTIPIARVVATRMVDQEGPLRLFYNANVFRYTQTQMGRYKEFYQLGVELIGGAGAAADAEVIALAAEVLARQALDFTIGINHIGIVNSLLNESELGEEDREQIKGFMVRKDLVGLEKRLSELQMDESCRHLLRDIPVLHGDTGVLSRLEPVQAIPGVDRAVKELAEVYEILRHYGVQDRVVIDLGVLRGFDYYTGIIFEGYSPNFGYPLLGGGRYDHLLEKFGVSRAATGFAAGIERLLLAARDRKPRKRRRFVVSGPDPAEVIRKARELRSEGHIAEVDLDNPGSGVLEVCEED